MELEVGRIYRIIKRDLIVLCTSVDHRNNNYNFAGISPHSGSTIFYSNYSREAVEEVHLRHPMFGKEVEVWDSGKMRKHTRVFIQETSTGCYCIDDVSFEEYRRGMSHDIMHWDNWEPFIEEEKENDISTPKDVTEALIKLGWTPPKRKE